MRKRILSLLPLFLCITFFTSCHRTTREMWEDTKTAGRYMHRGLDSFLGRHIEDETPFAFDDQESSNANRELDYLPLLSEDDQYVSSGHIPPARESPGEVGSSIPGIEMFKAPTGELAKLFNKIHFETDQYTVKGKDNIEILQEIANYLNKHSDIYVFIEGHGDERGAAAYNLSLGAKRSNSIRSFLAERGVDPDRMFTISYGKERPVAFGHDETAWCQNRRAEFKIFEKS